MEPAKGPLKNILVFKASLLRFHVNLLECVHGIPGWAGPRAPECSYTASILGWVWGLHTDLILTGWMVSKKGLGPKNQTMFKPAPESHHPFLPPACWEQSEHGCRMIYADVRSFFGSELEHGHVPTFWLLCMPILPRRESLFPNGISLLNLGL